MLASLVVIALVVGGLIAWRSSRADDAMGHGPKGTPKDLLLSIPLDRQPIPGWRTTAADIGLPPDRTVGRLFASSADKAYFVSYHAESDGSNPVGWVFGLDMKTGKPLFAPVELVGFRGTPYADCYGNGPSVAVCLTAGDPGRGAPQLVWVLDLDNGGVTFTGPTDLLPAGNPGPEPTVQAIGDFRGETHLVAAIENKGVYGVGPNAELTWFIPGSGILSIPSFNTVDDIPPLTIAVQSAVNPGDESRVFSVVDGKDLTPGAPAGTTIDKAAVYNGGFAYEFAERGMKSGILFYDTNGQLLARRQFEESNLVVLQSSGTPVMWHDSNPSEWQVYTAGGELLARIPTDEPTTGFKTIGTNLYVQQGVDTRWQQWDLRTGSAGKTCDADLDGPGYVGSDGKIVVTGSGIGSAPFRAIDMSTCETLWETSGERGLIVWKVGSGLIQRTDDAIVSLTAPT